MTATIIAAFAVAYFFAGIPVGLFVGRLHGIDDIRKHGSGNIGATNIMRVVGTKAGIAVWVIDCLKGVIPVLIARHLFGLEAWGVGLAGVGAVLGHCFSPYMGLTGGRGVSTGLGVMIGLFWATGVCALLVFILVVAKSKYISLGSIVGATSAVLWMLVFGHFVSPYTLAYTLAAAVCAGIIVYRHIPNIQRLRAGTENKLGQRKPAEQESVDGAEV